MKCELLLLLTACLAFIAADRVDGPFDFLISRCEDAEDVSNCVRDLVNSALDNARPKFSTGFEVGNKTVVLEPLEMPKPSANSRKGRSRELNLSKAQLSGLSQLDLDSVLLTDSTVAAKVKFLELDGEMQAKIPFGFLPLRATLKLKLLNPQLMVGAQYNASSEDLQLEQPFAKLWLHGFNATVTGLSSMGKTISNTLNKNHEEIFEFLQPSLEAAIVRRIEKLDQEERSAALGWLRSVLS